MPLPKKKSAVEPDYLKKLHLWYGAPKVGKTTIASRFGDDQNNKILFFATESGHKFQEIYKWQRENKKKELLDPDRWEHWVECCKELATTDHDFKCIAVDTLDNLWKWCSIYTLKRLNVQHESELGFGKGYAAVRDEFFVPLNYLAQNGYGIIFISHEQTQEKQFGPRKINYTDTTLPGTCRKLIHGVVDYILYFGSDLEGRRFIRTKGNENINAGDRSGNLPELIEMNSDLLKEHLT